MKIALQGSTIFIKDTTPKQFQTIKAWGLMKWDRKNQYLTGTVTLDLLEKLSGLVQLPWTARAVQYRLQQLQAAVDRERVNPAPVPAMAYPLKEGIQLYAHQVRAANMAALVFGWVKPDEMGVKQ